MAEYRLSDRQQPVDPVVIQGLTERLKLQTDEVIASFRSENAAPERTRTVAELVLTGMALYEAEYQEDLIPSWASPAWAQPLQAHLDAHTAKDRPAHELLHKTILFTSQPLQLRRLHRYVSSRVEPAGAYTTHEFARGVLHQEITLRD